ncbi:hypothetical protein BDFB_013448 [Asbolus verrucosus]|uniref:Uncharacterized protein n=1 Tax=Asbolus verrucosus TaxID=1661398 RepID=A0A482VLK3_ASBVE|nr:hypothetical protein BDFB_013448 [Asbolus verrucosus]
MVNGCTKLNHVSGNFVKNKIIHSVMS